MSLHEVDMTAFAKSVKPKATVGKKRKVAEIVVKEEEEEEAKVVEPPAKKPPTEKQLAARERAKAAREAKAAAKAEEALLQKKKEEEEIQAKEAEIRAKEQEVADKEAAREAKKAAAAAKRREKKAALAAEVATPEMVKNPEPEPKLSFKPPSGRSSMKSTNGEDAPPLNQDPKPSSTQRKFEREMEAGFKRMGQAVFGRGYQSSFRRL